MSYILICRPRKTLLDVVNTDLYIKKSTFLNNKVESGPALVKASNSFVQIENSTFLDNVGQHGLIEVRTGSHLIVKRSEFRGNGHVFLALSTIVVRPNSSASVSDSVFVNNMAASGAALCSFPDSSVIINRCRFSDNMAQEGGAINCHDQHDLDLPADNYQHSVNVSKENRSTRSERKRGKQVEEKKREVETQEVSRAEADGASTEEYKHEYENQEGGFLQNMILSDEFFHKRNPDAFFNLQDISPRCVITGSTFMNNHALPVGGAIYIRGRETEVANSSFSSNTGGSGGAIYGIYNSSIRIKHSSFHNNTAYTGSVVHVEQSSVLDIEESTFEYNDTEYLTGETISAKINSSVGIRNSSFRNQGTVSTVLRAADSSEVQVENSQFQTLAEVGSVVLDSQNDVRASFRSCSFNRSTGLRASENSHITVEGCLLTDSQHLQQGATVVAQFNSHVQFTNTTITDNHPQMSLPFLSVTGSSSAAIFDCVYSNNTRGRHVVVQTGSTLSILDSLFVQNYGRSGIFHLDSTRLFEVHDSQAQITRCIFQDNVFQNKLDIFPSSLIQMTNTDFNISRTMFFGNTADHVIVISTESLDTSPSKYVQIEQCVFYGNKGDISMTNTADVIIQSSKFSMTNQTSGGGGV